MLVSMQGLSWGDVGKAFETVGKIAAAPITVPIQASAYVVTQGIAAARQVRDSIKPPQPAAPATDFGALFGLGGGGAPGASSSSSSTLPLVLGGVAAAGLLVVALVMRGKRKASS